MWKKLTHLQISMRYLKKIQIFNWSLSFTLTTKIIWFDPIRLFQESTLKAVAALEDQLSLSYMSVITTQNVEPVNRRRLKRFECCNKFREGYLNNSGLVLGNI